MGNAGFCPSAVSHRRRLLDDDMDPAGFWLPGFTGTIPRDLGHFIFSLIGLKRILHTAFFKALKAPPRSGRVLVFGILGLGPIQNLDLGLKFWCLGLPGSATIPPKPTASLPKSDPERIHEPKGE